MTALFLIQGFQVAASRLRVLQYMPFLRAAGIDTTVIETPKTPRSWLSHSQAIAKADVIFVQRTRLPLYILLAFNRMGKRIIYDFDDAVMFKNSLAKNPYSLRRRMSFKRMLSFTDLVVAGNQFLKEEGEKYHRQVRVLPTPVDGERYRQKEYGERGTVTIGWIGDHGSIHYMKSYKDLWERIGLAFPQARLTIICDTFIETEHIPLRKVPWTQEHEIEDLQSLDIGVMPLFDDLWSRGKCGFKIIQYLGVGVPVVCTPIGINRDVVEDGANGFWASSKEEWYIKLSRLIEDKDLRETMGRNGYEKIMAGYTVQTCAPRLIEWIRGIA